MRLTQELFAILRKANNQEISALKTMHTCVATKVSRKIIIARLHLEKSFEKTNYCVNFQSFILYNFLKPGKTNFCG